MEWVSGVFVTGLGFGGPGVHGTHWVSGAGLWLWCLQLDASCVLFVGFIYRIWIRGIDVLYKCPIGTCSTIEFENTRPSPDQRETQTGSSICIIDFCISCIVYTSHLSDISCIPQGLDKSRPLPRRPARGLGPARFTRFYRHRI